MNTERTEKFVNAIACDLEEGGFRQVSGTTLRRTLATAVSAALPLLEAGNPVSSPAGQGDDLLPCPFCGNNAEFVPYKNNGLTVKCKSMGCIQRHQRTLRYGIEWLRASMTEHWNARAIAARQPGAQLHLPPDGYYKIVYDDAQVPDESFARTGALDAALRRFEQISARWNAHLFVRFANNTRDCTVPNAAPAQGIDLGPRPMDTAPRDGTMVRLLVQFTEHATEDTDGPSWTIGANNGEHDGGDLWCFAGWCWTHDHFTEGKGTPVGWLPLIDGQRDAAPGVGNG